MIYDFIVIGSGVSGGRIAYELTSSGASCLLLEAGKAYSAKTFPSEELDYSAQLFWGGGLEVSTDGRLGFLRAKCLGGTSVVNQALLDRFDDIAWQNWRDRTPIPFFNTKDMEAHYAACAAELILGSVPADRYNLNTRKFIRAFDSLGYGWKPLVRAQRDCKLDQGTDCIVCLGGCPRDSKESSLITTIAWALKKGLQIESEFEVKQIHYSDDHITIDGIQKGPGTPFPVDRKETSTSLIIHQATKKTFQAKKVVLAAGAFGNSAILLRSGFKNKLPALGTGFCCHPQIMTYAYFDEVVDAYKGAFQAVKSDDKKLRKAGLKLENVFAQPIGTAMLLPGVGKQHLRRMQNYRHFASMEVAICDDASGSIHLKGDKILIEKRLSVSDQSKIRSGINLIQALFESIGAQEVITSDQTFGLHLMGGCPIGMDPKTSVVSPDFHLHGFPHLYAADSSIFPAAPGINPSFTIMALSHRAAQGMLSASGALATPHKSETRTPSAQSGIDASQPYNVTESSLGNFLGSGESR